MTIRIGAAVRSQVTGKLGRIFRQPAGNIRGHILVQWDSGRDHEAVRIADVTFVADNYDTTKAWEAAPA